MVRSSGGTPSVSPFVLPPPPVGEARTCADENRWAELAFDGMPQRNAFPRGEGAPVRGRMRNGDLFRIGMHFVEKVHWERLYSLT